MKFRYIDKGVGNRVGDTIYLNRDLKNFPDLHDAVLKHELEHSSKFFFRDLLLDFNAKELKNVKLEYWKFFFTHPRAWVQLFPLMKVDGEWCFDLSLAGFWTIIILFILLML